MALLRGSNRAPRPHLAILNVSAQKVVGATCFYEVLRFRVDHLRVFGASGFWFSSSVNWLDALALPANSMNRVEENSMMLGPVV